MGLSGHRGSDPAAEIRRLRRRQADLDAAMDRAEGEPTAREAAFLGRVYSGGAIPATVPNTYLTHPVVLSGTESEGTAPTAVVNTAAGVPVVVLGPRVPIVGDDLLARKVGGRWVAQTGKVSGGDTVALTNCTGCTATPTTTHFTVTGGSCDGGILQNCTLVYGPTPAVYAPLALGANSVISVEEFTDGFGTYQYLLTCSVNDYALTRIYKSGFFGVFRDIVRYTWNVTGSGNSCSPFLLANGTIYSGGPGGCNGRIEP